MRFTELGSRVPQDRDPNFLFVALIRRRVQGRGDSVKGTVFDIQRFTVHDGPGIRTELFLKGCPLRCLWCSNPESQKLHRELAFYPLRCIGVDKCQKCVEVCPTNNLAAKENTLQLDRKTCTDCLKCVEVCPSGALSAFGRLMTVDEVMAEIIKDLAFYRKSNGGVTISGGDPLVQWEFTLEVLKKCRERRLHACLETEGYAQWEKIAELLPYVDLMLYDIKHMDPRQHETGTGASNELILENLKRIASAGTPLILRTPIIPRFNDSRENIRATAEFINTHLKSAVRQIQLLPYHRLGSQKYKSLGIEYPLESLDVPKTYRERIKQLADVMGSYGLPVIVGASE